MRASGPIAVKTGKNSSASYTSVGRGGVSPSDRRTGKPSRNTPQAGTWDVEPACCWAMSSRAAGRTAGAPETGARGGRPGCSPMTRRARAGFGPPPLSRVSPRHGRVIVMPDSKITTSFYFRAPGITPKPRSAETTDEPTTDSPGLRVIFQREN